MRDGRIVDEASVAPPSVPDRRARRGLRMSRLSAAPAAGPPRGAPPAGPHRARRAARRPARGRHGHGRHPHPHGRRRHGSRSGSAPTARPTPPGTSSTSSAAPARGLADRSPCTTTWMRLKAADGAPRGQRADRPAPRRSADRGHPRPGVGPRAGSRRRGRPVDRARGRARCRRGRRAGARASRARRPPWWARSNRLAASAAETAVFAPGSSCPTSDVRSGARQDTFLLVDLPDDLSAGGAERGARARTRRATSRSGSCPSCGTSSVTTGVRRRCAGASCWVRSCSPSSGS